MRKIETQGEIVDPGVKTTSEPSDIIENLCIEIPLWKYGRVRFQSKSQKASLALVAFIVILAVSLFLSILECFPGQHPAIASIVEKLGQALMLALGVVLGADWKQE